MDRRHECAAQAQCSCRSGQPRPVAQGQHPACGLSRRHRRRRRCARLPNCPYAGPRHARRLRQGSGLPATPRLRRRGRLHVPRQRWCQREQGRLGPTHGGRTVKSVTTPISREVPVKHSIVIVGWGIVFLALAGCSSDSAPARTSAAGSGQGGGGAKGGSAGQAGNQPGQGGGGGGAKGGSAGQAGDQSGQGGDQVTRDASSSVHDGASVDERTDASTTAADVSNDVDLDGGGWKILFNGKDLTGWTPAPGAAALFAADLLNGEGVIHVYPTQPDQSDQPQATLRTTASYSSYVFHEEYKWGTNRFGSRKQTDRDNGISFHFC